MSQYLTSSSEPTEENNKSVKLPSSEIFTVSVLLVLFIICNIITCYFHPIWVDEVLLTDPAANLYLGNGFTSSAWQYQTKSEFWAQNAPLHAVVLYHWMLLFGFNPVAVRALNYILMAASVLLIWLSVSRLKLVSSSKNRIILIALLTLGSGITFNYVSGRYDCLGITIFSLAFSTYLLSSLWLRCIIFVCLGIFMPMAGFHLVPYALILGLLLLIYLQKAFLREFVSVAVGMIIGVIFLYILYCTNGVADIALESIGGHSLADTVSSSGREAIGNAGLGEKIWFIINNLPAIFAERLKSLPEWFFRDRSFALLLVLPLFIAGYQIKNNNFKLKSVLSFSLLISFTIPIIFGILRNYPIYYSWMAYIPLAICTCSIATQFCGNNLSLALRLLILSWIALICFPGYIQKLTVSIPIWNDLDYSKVERFIDASITIDDIVYSEFEAYYPVKTKAKYAIFPLYLDVISPTEKAEISVLVANPKNTEEFARAASIIGGKWIEANGSLESKVYNLKIFRRKSDL